MIRKYILLIFSISFQLALGQSLKGTWVGDLVVGSNSLKFVVHLSHENSVWDAKADSPQQGAYNIPCKITHIDEESIELEIQGGIRYTGKLNTSNKIVGRFEQGAFVANLDLEKTVKQMAKRPQQVEPPYSYDTADVRFENVHDKIALSGTVTYPRSAGRFPAVVLVTGSGPQDRNQSLFGHQSFKVLADYLTKNNIVVLRYDDRGVGNSEGNFNRSNIADFSRDALAAVDFLKGHPRVDARKIGIIGHSEGGLIAFLLAGQNYPQLSFIAAIAGPATSIDQVMVKQLYRIGKVQGLTDEQLSKNEKINAKNFSILKSNLSDQQALEAIKENMKNIPEYSGNVDNELNQMISPSFRYFVRIEPEPFIKKIKIPVFAAYGGLDVQVDAYQNMYSLQKNLSKNKRNKVVEYPHLNHLFQTAITGNITEYGILEESFNQKVMEDFSAWIHSLFKK